MAVSYLTLVKFQRGVDGDYGNFPGISWEGKFTISTAGVSTDVLMPSGMNGATVSVSTTGTSCKIQSTSSPVDDVKDGNAIWTDWDLGSVSVNSQDTLDPCTAIRSVQVGTGSTIMAIRTF